MSEESGNPRSLVASAAAIHARRALPGWAGSILLGLCSGGALVALEAATGLLVSVRGTATRMQPILLLAGLPALLVVGWIAVRDWRRIARRTEALIGHALALAMVAVALPLSGYLLNSATSDPGNTFLFVTGGATTPGLFVALAAGFAFGGLSHDEGWGRSAGMGCLGCVAFLLVVGVILGIATMNQSPVVLPLLQLVGCLSIITAPIAGMVGGYLRGEPPRE